MKLVLSTQCIFPRKLAGDYIVKFMNTRFQQPQAFLCEISFDNRMFFAVPKGK